MTSQTRTVTTEMPNIEIDSARETKNAIFAAKEAAERAGFQSQTKEEAFKKEFGLDIPVSLVPLPSLGIVYSQESPLHLKEQVEIKGMTTREEDILMSRALIKKGTVITELIKSCLITPGVEVSSLIGGDRNALMVSIRILGYGSDYDAEVNCPKCEHKNTIKVDLNQLDVKDLKTNPVALGENRFSFVLPITKKNVHFRFLTGKEEEEILATMEARKKRGLPNDNVVTTRLLYSILSIENVSDRNKIAQFIGNMPARDSMALRQYMDEIEPGIDMKFEFNCSNCEHYEVMALPLGPNFFWPKS